MRPSDLRAAVFHCLLSFLFIIVYFPQQNRLYPTISSDRITTVVQKLTGRKTINAIPSPKENRKKPHNRFIMNPCQSYSLSGYAASFILTAFPYRLLQFAFCARKCKLSPSRLYPKYPIPPHQRPDHPANRSW